jgi:hypothetical protein
MAHKQQQRYALGLDLGQAVESAAVVVMREDIGRC